MRIDLSKIKVGDKVFSVMFGECVVNRMNADNFTAFPIEIISTTHDNIIATYNMEGLSYSNCVHPCLFHSVNECIEYFQFIKKEMDEASKPKKRYWLWSYRNLNGNIIQGENYLDDNGMTTNRQLHEPFNASDTKIKHENEFIDV